MPKSQEKISPHWIDKLTTDLITNWHDIKEFNCNSGISVSGKQHVGRLRGEIILTNAVVCELKRRGFLAIHYLILYTSDPWKGKEAQLNAFFDPLDARKYINWRLIDVPDPTGQYSSWVDYFWKEFGDHLSKFSHNVKIIRTHELYRKEQMKKTVISLIKERNQIRKILNKYRKENPLPENWIPINPLCNKCNNISTTTALEVNLDDYLVQYYCNTCQNDGWSDISLGKLTWRLEWLAIWFTLNIHFEPYGKDHATPGGSRDSCIEILEKVLNHRGPYGFWNEWVGYSEGQKDFGDMTSSGFIGFTPNTWLKYADPLVLRYLYIKQSPKRRIVLGLDKIPQYINEYDKAERIYFGLEPFNESSELNNIRRSYEITFYNKPPEHPKTQLDFMHAIILSQLVSSDIEGTNKAIQKLQETNILNMSVSSETIDYIHNRLKKARNWVTDHAPPHLRINIPKEIPSDLINQTNENSFKLILELTNSLKTINWTEDKIKNKMITIKDQFKLSSKEMNNLFTILYQIFLGMPQGPRLAPFLAALEKKWVLARLETFINN